MKSCDLFIATGEKSGDLHGELIIKALLDKNPSLQISAVAGPHMRKHPINTILHMEKLQVMGFIDVILSLPSLIRIFFQIRNAILKLQPKAILLIDYPGLHLRLARSLRKKGYKGKIIQYVCPSVWAWGKKRIPVMAQNLDHLLSIFPFEKKYFKNTKLPVSYVGNPLVTPLLPRKPENIITLFPGSRKKELEKNLPIQVSALKKLQLLHPQLVVGISLSHEEHRVLIKEEVRKQGLKATIFTQLDKESWIKKTLLAIATSGTITLELALQKIPTVVTYAIRPLDEWIAKKVFKICLPFYSLPNIVAGKEVFPELFGHNLSKKSLFTCVKNSYTNKQDQKNCELSCIKLREQFGNTNSITEITQIIIKNLTTSRM